MILAIATETDVIIYDTQQAKPVAHLQKIHYTKLTDISWSKDGLLLVASSSDGFCTIVSFEENELGVVYKEKLEIEEAVKDTVLVEEKESVETTPKLEVKKRPTMLEQWAIKTPKRKIEDEPEDGNIKTESPTPFVNKLTPKRIKPIQIKDDTKSPTVKKKSVENTNTPKKKGTILNFVTTVDKRTEAAIVADEEARDAWKTEDVSKGPTKSIENNKCIVMEDSIEDFKLEISVSQSEDVCIGEKNTDAEADEVEESKDVADTVDNNSRKTVDESELTIESSKIKVENKENEKLNSTQTTNGNESNNNAGPSQPLVKKPRRVELITLSSPRSKKK